MAGTFARRRAIALLGVFVAATSLVLGACGKDGRARVELIVPFAAGGGSDALARAAGKGAEGPLDAAVTPVNKPGGNGIVAMTDVANAADDKTVIAATNAMLAWQPHLSEVSYSVDDFVGIASLGVEPIVLATKASSRWKSIDDLVAEPARITFGHAGVGGFGHVAALSFLTAAGVKNEGVPFDGGAPTVVALLGGNVDIIAATPAEVLPHVESGDLRILGVFATERLDEFPDVPTLKESGYDLVFGVSRFILASSKISDDALEDLRTAFGEAVDADDFQKMLKKRFVTFEPVTGDEIMATLRTESESAQSTLDALGID